MPELEYRYKHLEVLVICEVVDTNLYQVPFKWDCWYRYTVRLTVMLFMFLSRDIYWRYFGIHAGIHSNILEAAVMSWNWGCKFGWGAFKVRLLAYIYKGFIASLYAHQLVYGFISRCKWFFCHCLWYLLFW